MLISLQQIQPKETFSQQPSTTRSNNSQYGRNLAPEIVTHITSYLDPPQLSCLGLVNWTYAQHVKDDHTWHMVFVRKFIGLDPHNTDLDNDGTHSLLRRTESTWRKECIFRYRVLRRWTNSRAQTVSHIPVHSPITAMHVLETSPGSTNAAGPALLTSSLQYGIIARSWPLRGSAVRGYLSPSQTGQGLGLGIGNPNTEFAPNVTASAMTSAPGLAKIAWGMRNGEVALMTATGVMERRNPAKLTRCKVDEEHLSEVTEISWDANKEFFVTGARDGSIKLWDTRMHKLRCVWTSPMQNLEATATISVVKVLSVLAKETLVAVMASGQIVAWHGFHAGAFTDTESRTINAMPVSVLVTPGFEDDTPSDQRLPKWAHADHRSLDQNLRVLIMYPSQTTFHCVSFDLTRKARPTVAHFRDTMAAGAVFTCLVPFTAPHPGQQPIIITGDHYGYVSIFRWSGTPQEDGIKPIERFAAAPGEGAITALAWNSLILAVGSATGVSSVFDGITFKPLRTFASPLPRIRSDPPDTDGDRDSRRAVKHILLSKERDTVIICAGERVLCWKASAFKSQRVIKSPGKGKKKMREQKGHTHYDLHKDVKESMNDLRQETEMFQRVHKREKEQRDNLEKLGLDEAGVLEYVMMLSREEAMAGRSHDGIQEEGPGEIFDWDSGDHRSQQDPSPPLSVTDWSSESASDYMSSSEASYPLNTAPFAVVNGSFGSLSHSNLMMTSSSTHAHSVAPRKDAFPAISPSTSPKRTPSKVKSAWAAPLPVKPVDLSVLRTAPSPTRARPAPQNRNLGVVDEEEALRQALELSLVEQ